jgi:YVTN family beta-propeller protein
VIRGEAVVLFLSVESAGMTAGEVVFEPQFSLVTASRQLFSLNGYVSNPGTNRLTVFNKKTMQVTNVIATGRKPTGMVIARLRKRLYVACLDDDRIEEIDIADNTVRNRIELRVGDGPIDLALTADGQSLLSANFRSNTVSLIDLRSRVEITRFSVGRRPAAVVADATGTYAFSVNSLSNSVTVIDLPRLAPVASLPVETTPLRAALEPAGGRLFVINRDSPNLSVIRAEPLQVTDRVFTGAGAISIVADPQSRLVYVGNDTGDIQVFDPTSLMFVDSITAEGPVKHLTIDREENCLFAVRPEKRVLQKVNLTSKRILSEIEVDKGAYAVAVVGER